MSIDNSRKTPKIKRKTAVSPYYLTNIPIEQVNTIADIWVSSYNLCLLKSYKLKNLLIAYSSLLCSTNSN